MNPIIKLINIYFWKSFYGPFFVFVFPLIFVGLLGALIGYESVLATAFLIPSTAISVNTFPQAIFEFKQSTILKRIGVTPIKPWYFIFIVFIYFFFMMIIGTVWCLLFALIIFSSNYWDVGREISYGVLAPSIKDTLMNVNWGGFVYGIILNIFVGISMGMLIICFAKNGVSVQVVGTVTLMLTCFIAPQVLPIAIISNVDALNYMGYLIPFKQTTALVAESWTGDINNSFQLVGQSNIFDINQNFSSFDMNGKLVEVFDKPEKIINLVLPYFWIILFSVISIRFFKWSVR